MPVISVEHLNKMFRIYHEKRTTLFETITGIFHPNSYEILYALKDINFTVEESEMFGIIGENGSGKSTLLGILANILRPTSGSVTVTQRVTPFLELGIGFNPEFTAVENIRTYGSIMGMPSREIDDRIGEILEFADLEKFRDTKLKNFSSGMNVRLAFSTAIQTNPEILLLDEVLAVGDMDFRKKCLKVLKRYKNEGVTIVFVSHDLYSIKSYCRRTLLISNGKQIGLGDPEDIVDLYKKRSAEGNILKQTPNTVSS